MPLPPLTERLKALGVKLGPSQLQPSAPPQTAPRSIEQAVPGREVHAAAGQPAYVAEQFYATSSRHGAIGLHPPGSWRTLALWAGDSRLADLPLDSLVFLDTETSGLSSGAGTLVFMVGAGRFEGDTYHLAQFFLRDPGEEPAMLLALEEFLAPCRTMVTFNGKSFDAPLLNGRYTLQGWRSPLHALGHIDLLHLARRLFRDTLPSRSLGSLETAVMGFQRSEEEIPGWMVPEIYADYLRSGDATQISRVFYHNAMDVISLAALLGCLAPSLEAPLEETSLHFLKTAPDAAALGRLFEDLGDEEQAIQLYQRGLESGLPNDLHWDTHQRLALLHKRRSESATAQVLWEQAAHECPLLDRKLFALEEMAKIAEHQHMDYAAALSWTEQALGLLPASKLHNDLAQVAAGPLSRAAFEHRKERLLRKLSPK